MKRGLTLIELLAALIILGGLTAAIVPWLQTTSHLYTDVAPGQLWRVSAERALDQIGSDLDTGDFIRPTEDLNQASSQVDARPDRPPRVNVSTDGLTLSIATRTNALTSADAQTRTASAAITRQYSLNELDETITCQDEDLGRPSSSAKRVLLRDVVEWHCFVSSIDFDQRNDEDPTMRWMLTVEIQSEMGDKATRTYLVRE